jgi:pimeloyl-ACP methyl ester carboxylesterase
VESAIFRIHRAADTWARLPAAGAPVHLVAGDPALPERGWVSACMADMAAQLPRAHLTTLAGTGHMMIFEQPNACRDLLLGMIGSARDMRFARA